MKQDSENQEQETPQNPPFERPVFTSREELLITEAVQRLFPNIKIFIDEKFQEILEQLREIQDAKNNIATLSTVLSSKEIFTKEEFTDCHKAMVQSFGVVDNEGKMKGQVSVTDFNLGGDRL